MGCEYMSKKSIPEQLKQHMDFISKLPTMVHAINDKGLLVNVSDFWLKKMGYERKDVIGRSSSEFLTQESKKYAENAALPDFFNKGIIENVPYQFVKKDKTIIDVLLSASSILDEHGVFICSLAIIVDVTEKMLAEKALRESENKLRSTLDATPFPVAVVDLRDNQIIYWSSSAFELFGHTAPTTSQWYEIAYPDSDYRQDVIEKWKPFLEIAKTSGHPVNTGEYQITCKDGSVKICDLYISFLPDNLIVTFNDITDRKKTEEVLRESEKKYRTLFESTEQGVVYQSATGSIISANPAAERILGLSINQMQGRTLIDPCWKTIYEDGSDFPGKAHPAMVALKCGEPVKNIIMGIFNPQNESYNWVIVNATPQFKPGEKEPYQVYATLADITENKKAERDLQASEKKYRELIELAQEGIWVIDKNHNTTFANPSMAKMLGYAPAEMTGKHLFYFMDEAAIKIANANLERRQKGMVEQHDFEFLRKDGQRIITTMETAPVLDEDGNYCGAIAGVLDITKRRETEQEKKGLQVQLAQAQKMEAIGTLAGGIAHDFNNILSAILGYSQLVKEELPDGSPADNDIDMVIQSSIRAAELVKQILTFSRKTELQLQSLTPHPIIKEALQMLRSTLPTTIEIKEDIDKECGNIKADPTNIHQIMVNLCSNALHAMDQQKGTLTVRLSHENLETEDVKAYKNVSAGSFVVLSVSDTGNGMDTKTMQRIFEPYFTTKGVGKGSGSGIGLSVIHGIVLDCKGFIRVESTLGQGSTFYIYIPALKESSADKNDMVTTQKSEAPLPKGSGRILVVDDEELLVRVNKRRLEHGGYTVTTTTNGRCQERCRLF